MHIKKNNRGSDAVSLVLIVVQSGLPRTVSTTDPQGSSFGSCDTKEEDNDGKWGADATWVLPSGLKASPADAFLPLAFSNTKFQLLKKTWL